MNDQREKTLDQSFPSWEEILDLCHKFFALRRFIILFQADLSGSSDHLGLRFEVDQPNQNPFEHIIDYRELIKALNNLSLDIVQMFLNYLLDQDREPPLTREVFNNMQLLIYSYAPDVPGKNLEHHLQQNEEIIKELLHILVRFFDQQSSLGEVVFEDMQFQTLLFDMRSQFYKEGDLEAAVELYTNKCKEIGVANESQSLSNVTNKIIAYINNVTMVAKASQDPNVSKDLFPNILWVILGALSIINEEIQKIETVSSQAS